MPIPLIGAVLQFCCTYHTYHMMCTFIMCLPAAYLIQAGRRPRKLLQTSTITTAHVRIADHINTEGESLCLLEQIQIQNSKFEYPGVNKYTPPKINALGHVCKPSLIWLRVETGRSSEQCAELIAVCKARKPEDGHTMLSSVQEILVSPSFPVLRRLCLIHPPAVLSKVHRLCKYPAGLRPPSPL